MDPLVCGLGLSSGLTCTEQNYYNTSFCIVDYTPTARTHYRLRSRICPLAQENQDTAAAYTAWGATTSTAGKTPRRRRHVHPCCHQITATLLPPLVSDPHDSLAALLAEP